MFAILLPIPPRGGDVFWVAKIETKPQDLSSTDGFQLCKGYLLFSTGRRPSTSVRCFMVNLIFYTMKYGGNTNWK